MSARRTLIIIVAIAVGAVAAISTVLYVNSVQSRANHNAKLVGVYVVAKDIPKGTKGDDAINAGLIKSASIPQQFYPVTAVTDLSSIKGKITPTELVPGQILVGQQFVEPNVANTSFSGTNIPPGQVAISISLSGTAAVGNFIVPGDKIDLMGVFKQVDAAGKTVGADPVATYAHFFYQNVNVIAIGSSAAPTQGQTTPATNPGSGVFTLAVPPQAAERIVLASQNGTVIAALVPPDNQPVNIPAVQQLNIDGPNPPNFGPAPALTPYG